MHMSTARYTLSSLDLDLKEARSRFPVPRAYGAVRKTKVRLIRTKGEGSTVRYFTSHNAFSEVTMTATDKCKSP